MWRMKAATRLHAPLFLLLLLAGEPVAAAAALQVHDAWIEEGPPGMTVLAGYLDIENRGDTVVQISGIRSDAAGQIEIHRTELHDGTASMVELATLSLPPHTRLKFRQGGYHLMLMGLRGPLKAGDKVDLQLRLGDGRNEGVAAEVRRGDAEPM